MARCKDCENWNPYTEKCMEHPKHAIRAGDPVCYYDYKPLSEEVRQRLAALEGVKAQVTCATATKCPCEIEKECSQFNGWDKK